MSASINALGSYVKIPAVWLNGIITAIGIMAIYFVSVYISPFVGIIVFLLFLNIIPLILAGTYGMILDGNTKKGSFMVYARYGYPRCLSPALFLIAICLLLYILLGPFGLLIALPILFFTYFADITAIRHNLKTGQAIKDSSRRVMSGSILVVIFYIGNIIACFLFFLTIDLIFGLTMQVFVPSEQLTSLTTLLESTVTTISQNLFTTDTANQELLVNIASQIFSTPGITLALSTATAGAALLFMPFFVAYKAYFFRDLLIAEATLAAVVKAAQERAQQQTQAGENSADVSNTLSAVTQVPAENAELPKLIPEHAKEPAVPQPRTYDPHAGEDGEYDAKGRWFKYK